MSEREESRKGASPSWAHAGQVNRVRRSTAQAGNFSEYASKVVLPRLVVSIVLLLSALCPTFSMSPTSTVRKLRSMIAGRLFMVRMVL